MTGEVGAWLGGRVLRLSPGRRVVTVALRRVGRGPSYSGAYAGATGQLAPVRDLRSSRQVGRVITVNPTPAGAEVDMVVGDDDAWQALASGTARVDVQCAFEASSAGEPIRGRPVRVQIV